MSGTGAFVRFQFTFDASDVIFTLGNEVRTVIPEPSTGMLLGLGLLSTVGLAGGVVEHSATDEGSRSADRNSFAGYRHAPSRCSCVRCGPFVRISLRTPFGLVGPSSSQACGAYVRICRIAGPEG